AMGTVAVVFCLLLLGWTGEVVGLFVKDPELKREATIALAIVDIYVLDFVINIAQSTCRALVVDTLPIEKQQLGSAWVSRMIGVGHMMMYGIGALDLEGIFGDFLGDTQFKKVCLIAAIAMAVAQGTSCWAVHERVLVSDGSLKSSNEGLLPVLKQIYSTTINLPPRIHAICMVQFWSWIGWFPFLFYGSTWVGEIFMRTEAPGGKADALTDVGRAGSIAFIVFAMISFGSSIVLPWIIESPEDDDKPGYTPRPPQGLQTVAGEFRKPTLLTAWKLGCATFASAMIFAPFVNSVRFATIVIALCGVPWAIAGWAPGSFL
ncbi:sucrose transport protein, partial [Hortaea werneckii]